jgi:DNA polymerase I-like protein with 3'-5' exonuclease and polymerase domains
MRQQGITESFSPPELKNYPVQGTGGEIVQIVLGYLWRWFTKTGNFGGKALLVNTVHDCVWVDMHPDVVHTVIPGMKRIMEAVPAMLKKHFNIECPSPSRRKWGRTCST